MSQDQAPPRPAAVVDQRATVKVPAAVAERARGIVAASRAGELAEPWDTLGSLVAAALAVFCSEVEQRHNGGRPFPPPGHLPTGPGASGRAAISAARRGVPRSQWTSSTPASPTSPARPETTT